jgi:FtsZ-interacting cell division protein ZipA
MATSTTVLIVVAAVVAILLIAGLTWVARNRRNQHRHVEADNIREDARHETLHVKQQEALAEETAAKARAAQAEADVKAAQAAGLQQQAAVHRGEAVTSRDHLNEQWDRADTLDPASGAAETPPSGDRTKTPGTHQVAH